MKTARLMLRLTVCSLFTCTSLVSPLAYGAARFLPLGYLDEADDFSFGEGISADGETIAGESSSKAYRWTETEGMVYLGDVPGGGNVGTVKGISGDGNVIFGSMTGGEFQWTQAAGYQVLFPGTNVSLSGIAYDGSAYSYDPDTDISADGTITVGREVHLLGVEAYRDSPNGFGGTTRQWLGDLPGGEYGSIPLAVSANGEVVVGQSSTTADNMGTTIDISRPFYWTEERGIIALESWSQGSASDVSDSGLVVIGGGTPAIGMDWETFRWTPATGMVSIRELLLDEGIDIASMGWTEMFVSGVSANGRIIVGTGAKPNSIREALLIELPVPGDFDEDGDSDGTDFLKWQRGESYDPLSTADLDDWEANWNFFSPTAGASTNAISATIPEPSSIALLLAAYICSLRWRCQTWAAM